MDNKRRKGFNTSDVPLEICLLQGEVAEFFQAWRRKQKDVGEELADVAIYLLGLAEMIGVDLQDEIASKMRKNAQRIYHRREDGLMVRVGEA
jgi:NTP pyrophosphatase (non-canonical NTP hydrolase)